MLRPHHFVDKQKIRDFMKFLLYSIVHKIDIMNSLEQWVFHIYEFHNKHVILPMNNSIPTVFKEERCMYCLTQTGFINGQDESRCYVHSSFKIQFLNLYFRQLILGIDRVKIIEQLDDSEDKYISKFQNIVIMQENPILFDEMLIGGRK